MKAALKAGSLAALTAMIAGCAAMGPDDSDPTPAEQVESTMLEAARDRADADAAPPDPPPAAVTEDLLPPMTLAPERRDSGEPRFDIDVQEAPVRAFFTSLVEGTPHNMVVHPEVDGTISLTLKDVTIPETMAMVQEVYGYEYRRKAGGFVVLPRELRSRIFHVDYLNLRRWGRSSTVVSSGELSRASDDDSGIREAGDDDNGGRGGESGGSQAAYGTSLRSTTEADLWRELETGLRTIVGDEGGRSVVVSPQSSMIVVRAMPAELREIEDFLTTAQSSLRRQVVLEAKILEVELSEGFQSGINWAALSESSNGDVILGSQTGGGTVISETGTGDSDIAGQQGNLNPNNLNQVNNTLTSAFGGVFSAAFQLNDFTAFIELLQTQGDVQVLSSPRVSTVNNQKAVIKVGSDEFFATDIETTTVTGDSTVTSPSVELAAFFSGIALDVTPQISDDGEVVLHVHPTISEIQDQRKEFTVGGQVQSIPLALSTVRESDSIVRARSGQIVVIGGLMQETVENRTASVPLLGDLPLVGGLFQHNRQVRNKTELVILLKPLVVNEDADWSGPLESGSERLQRLHRRGGDGGGTPGG